MPDHFPPVGATPPLYYLPALFLSACGHALPPRLDEIMRRMGHKIERNKRILELNPKHELIAKLRRQFEADAHGSALKDYARLLYGQALLAESSPLPDPAGYGRLIAELMTKSL